jgi:uncharacterized membrane protein YgcG
MQFLKTHRVSSFFFATLLALPLLISSQPKQNSQNSQSQASGDYTNQQPRTDPDQPQSAPPNAPEQEPAPQPHNPPVIGTINYVEGQASIGNEALDAKSVGNAVLQEGQSLTTGNGKVEILLTPGVFFRVGDNSTVRMVSPSLSNTEVAVDHGDATLEVAQIQKENNIVVDLPEGKTRVLKKGFYEFNASENVVRVFKGEARLMAEKRGVTIKENHELALSDPKLKPRGFKKEQYDTADLYRWSVLRSSYLAEANVDAASRYVDSGRFSPGWYWDPWFAAYTWIPGDGIFYSPFGWGFYSPFYVYDAPFFYYGYYGGPYRRHFGRDFHAWDPGPHYGPHPEWHGNSPGVTPHAYHGFGGGMHDSHGFGAHGGGGFHGGGGMHGGGGGGRH